MTEGGLPGDEAEGELPKDEADRLLPNPSRQVIRKMLREENTLRDQRLSYVLTINGFLFAGLGFAWNGPEAKRLVVLLAVFGVAIALITMQAMETSSQAFAELRKCGEALRPDDGLPLVGLWGEQIKGLAKFFRWLQPWYGLPGALLIVWPALAIARLV